MFVLALLGYIAIRPYLLETMQDLPTLAQQVIGLLFITALFGFLYWYLPQAPRLYTVFLAGSYIAMMLGLLGVWPAVTLPVALVFLAAAFLSLFAGPAWRFVQNRRKA